MDIYNELLTINYWEIIKQIADKNNISLKEAVEKYHDISGLPSQEVYEKIINLTSQINVANPNIFNEQTIQSNIYKYSYDAEIPFATYIFEQFNCFLNNVDNLNKNSIAIDVKILMQLIFFKYSGDEIFKIIEEMKDLAKKRYNINT